MVAPAAAEEAPAPKKKRGRPPKGPVPAPPKTREDDELGPVARARAGGRAARALEQADRRRDINFALSHYE